MFDNIVYLNRDIDTLRKEKTENQLTERGLTATRFPAIVDNVSEYLHIPVPRVNPAQESCLVSHLEIIRTYGMERDLLVFEDDIDLSVMDHWDFTLSDLTEAIPDTVGITQLFFFPAPDLVKALRWTPGYFGTSAYLIRSWYVKDLVSYAYTDNKWDIRKLQSHYVQLLADSVLYSNTDTMSLSVFATRNEVSTILPHASYVDAGQKAINNWATKPTKFKDILISIENYVNRR